MAFTFEAAAKALVELEADQVEADTDGAATLDRWDALKDDLRDDYRTEARAALTAALETQGETDG